MRHVYHYAASIPSGYGAIYEIDGLIEAATPIVTRDNYLVVKQKILENHHLEILSAVNLTIKSLSLLQTLED